MNHVDTARIEKFPKRPYSQWAQQVAVLLTRAASGKLPMILPSIVRQLLDS